MGIARRLIREFGLALVVAGLIVLLFVGYQLLGTKFTEEHSQTLLGKQFSRALAAHAATVPSTTLPSTTPTTVPGATTIPGSTTPTSAPTATTAPTPATTTPGGSAADQTAASGPDNPTVGASPAEHVPVGQALARLKIPAIGLDKYVVQGTSQSDLTKGPGHYPETALPGQVGNAAIAGHRTTYGAPFFRLDSLKAGDRILVTDTSDRQFTYRVASVEVVSPSDVAVLAPTKTAQLTLTTCNPRFGESSRLIVVAKMVTTKAATQPPATTAPTTTPTTTPGATTTTTTAPTTTVPTSLPQQLSAAGLGVGDHSARTPAIFYGVAVVALWVLTRIAVHHTRRWWRTLAYVVGIVACLALLWFFFENVIRLLPPNI